MNQYDMIGKWIMGCNADSPVAGKVIGTCQQQYPNEEVSYKVSCIEGSEGWLDEGQYIEFDQNKWNYILGEWNKILVAKENIKSILRL